VRPADWKIAGGRCLTGRFGDLDLVEQAAQPARDRSRTVAGRWRSSNPGCVTEHRPCPQAIDRIRHHDERDDKRDLSPSCPRSRALSRWPSRHGAANPWGHAPKVASARRTTTTEDGPPTVRGPVVTSRRRAPSRCLLLVVIAWRAQRSARPTARLLRYHRWYRPSALRARIEQLPRQRRSAR
jgi:hypothetical protein